MERVQSTKAKATNSTRPRPDRQQALARYDQANGDSYFKGAQRDRRFAQLYVQNPNAKQCAIAVGLAPKSAAVEGSKLLAKPNVQAMILAHRQRLEAKTDVTTEKLLAELGKIAFASMQDYMVVDEDGQPHLDMSLLTEDQWSSIGEITTEVFFDGPKGAEREVKRTKFKLHDKLSAIDKAIKMLGGYKQGAGEGEGGNGGNTTTVYTLNIGNANILVQKDGAKQPLPKVLEG